MTFRDRTEAGNILAKRMTPYKKMHDLLVLGIPRGGVPVAFQVAAELHAPLDVFIVRKLGVPGREELAFGAIASGGLRILDSAITESFGISETEIERITARERHEVERREQTYRAGRAPLAVEGRNVILVDDGIATGSSMRAAIDALRAMKPRHLVVAVPVASASACRVLRSKVDDLICVHMPDAFYAIGEFYEDFSQVSDQTVSDLLHEVPDVARRTAA